jgi:HSP20 family molecular chaperone IbpA
MKLFREFDDLFDAFNRPLFYTGWDDAFRTPLLFPAQSSPAVRKDNGGGSTISPRSNLPKTSVTSSWYEVHADKDKIQLAVDVPGMKLNDITVKLEQDGRILRIKGERKLHEGALKSERKLEKTFVLEKENVDIDNISANLSDGVLLITLPRKIVSSSTTKEIPITENVRLEQPPTVVDDSTTADAGTTEEQEINLDDTNFDTVASEST